MGFSLFARKESCDLYLRSEVWRQVTIVPLPVNTSVIHTAMMTFGFPTHLQLRPSRPYLVLHPGFGMPALVGLAICPW